MRSSLPLKQQTAEAGWMLLTMVGAFPAFLALAFWLRFDIPLWEVLW